METKLKKYYLYGLLPALIFAFILILLGDFMMACFLMVGFMWPYSSYTPNMREKLKERNNRMSFINISIRVHDFLFEKLGKKVPHTLIHMMIPISFALIIFTITGDARVIFILLGLVLFELFLYYCKKKKLEIF